MNSCLNASNQSLSTCIILSADRFLLCNFEPICDKSQPISHCFSVAYLFSGWPIIKEFFLYMVFPPHFLQREEREMSGLIRSNLFSSVSAVLLCFSFPSRSDPLPARSPFVRHHLESTRTKGDANSLSCSPFSHSVSGFPSHERP